MSKATGMLVSPDMRASIERCYGQKLINGMFCNHVLVQFEHDLGHLWFADAFIKEDPVDKRFIWVMTEHHDYHVYARDEIRACVEYQRVTSLLCGDDWDKQDEWKDRDY